MSEEEKKRDIDLRVSKLERRLHMLFIAWVASIIAGGICIALLGAHLYHDAVMFDTLFDIVNKFHHYPK